eukprot:18327-Heterococcus_DN1.PRE.1
MDGADKKEQARLMALLKPIAEQRAAATEASITLATVTLAPAAIESGGAALLTAPRKVAFLAATEIDQLSGAIRKICNLDEIQGKWKFMKSKKPRMKPRLALVSIVEGKFKVSDAPEVNEQTINAFLQQYDADTLEMDSFKA